MIRERVCPTLSGWLVLPVLLALEVALIWALIAGIGGDERAGYIAAIAVLIVFVGVLYAGFFIVNPNDARVMLLFGKYAGSVKRDGFHWANPLLRGRRFSLRVRNFESAKIKVNDHEGNPIEIAAVVVWRVYETAEAAFEVDDYEHYVKVQSEAAVRNLATQYPYDAYLDGHKSLRANTAEIAEQLKVEVQ
jgi:regulator of protease activity HflC (stomatin/prohibitin superfamily)